MSENDNVTLDPNCTPKDVSKILQTSYQACIILHTL